MGHVWPWRPHVVRGSQAGPRGGSGSGLASGSACSRSSVGAPHAPACPHGDLRAHRPAEPGAVPPRPEVVLREVRGVRGGLPVPAGGERRGDGGAPQRPEVGALAEVGGSHRTEASARPASEGPRGGSRGGSQGQAMPTFLRKGPPSWRRTGSRAPGQVARPRPPAQWYPLSQLPLLQAVL